MKRKTNVFNTLKDLVILTANSGDIMPEEVEPIAEKARVQLGLETAVKAIHIPTGISVRCEKCDFSHIFAYYCVIVVFLPKLVIRPEGA